MTDGPRFSVDLRMPADGAAVVTVAGELDMSTAPVLEAALESGVDRGAGHIVVDLDSVSFIDSTGIRAIVCAAVRLHAAGGSLRLVYGDEGVQHLFEILALENVVGTYPCRRVPWAPSHAGEEET